MSQPIYTTIDSGLEVKATARLIHHAFAGTIADCEEWIRRADVGLFRVLRESPGAAPAACLVGLPMGQFFGGKSVPMRGVAGVATAPEARGRGHALAMMREFVREVDREGVPISTLYPSTQTLYRQVGFEQAGYRFEIEIPLGSLRGERGALEVRMLDESHMGVAMSLYQAWAVSFDGTLDRGPYCWGRVRSFRGDDYDGFGVFDPGGRLRGYLFLTQTREGTTGRFGIKLTDFVFADRDAGQALLRFLADFSSMGSSVLLYGHPGHPILYLMDSVAYSVRRKDYWMTRIVDARAALMARGYASTVSTRFALQLSDDLVERNNRPFTLSVNRGGAAIEEGVRAPLLRLDIRALAALFTGYLTGRQAALLGLLRTESGRPMTTDEEAVRSLESVFAGNGPAMCDMF